MASITKLLRRQPQTSEAELEFVRERTVARLNGLSGETDASAATAVADAIPLDAPVDIVIESEAPTVELDALVEVETVIVEPDAMVEPEPEPEAIVETVVAEPEVEPTAIVEGDLAEPEAEAIAEPLDATAAVNAEPAADSEAGPSPKRRRRFWSSSSPTEVEAKPEAIVEAPPVEPEPEPEPVAVVVPAPEPVVVEPEPETVVGPEPVAVVEPEPEPEAEAVVEPMSDPIVDDAWEIEIEPVAIPVVAERSIDIRRESIWESKPAVVEPAPEPAPARARTPRPPRPKPVTKPAAVAVAPAPGTTFCPYCALSLVPAPTATRRCPRCRQRIIVKHVQGHVVYLTEASVAVFDAERQRAVDGVRWAKERTQWLKLAAGVGATSEKVAKLERARLTEAVVTSSRQLYMSTAERAFRAAKREDRWEIASRVRREQAAALHKAAGLPVPPPDDTLALHREAVAVELRGINKMAKSVQLIGSNCCEACEADDGRTFRIVTEMRETRLPHADCPKGLCRCHWDLAVRDEAMVRRYLQRKDRGSRGKRATGDPTVQAGE